MNASQTIKNNDIFQKFYASVSNLVGKESPYIISLWGQKGGKMVRMGKITHSKVLVELVI